MVVSESLDHNGSKFFFIRDGNCREPCAKAMQCFSYVKVNLRTKFWFFLCISQEYNSNLLSIFRSVICQGVAQLWEVNNERNFQTFSPKSGLTRGGRLQEVPDTVIMIWKTVADRGEFRELVATGAADGM